MYNARLGKEILLDEASQDMKENIESSCSEVNRRATSNAVSVEEFIAQNIN